MLNAIQKYMGEVDAPDPVQLRKSILEWYATHKRILPWRAESFQAVNPYHVFVSEIMLQQTTVQTVIPYFLKFVGRFSNWTDLAAAKEDEVFSFWQGLGYYRRASNLHKAAKMVCEEHNEVLPATVDHLLRLPGVGAYTAKAVASIAFEQPVVPVDGNVVRVLARVFGIEDVLPILKKKVDQFALFFESQVSSGDLAQSLMDLGATVCKPVNPNCDVCPWKVGCVSFFKGIQNKIPAPKEKKVIPSYFCESHIYWVKENNDILVHLEKRDQKGIWENLYCFPLSPFEERSTLEKPGPNVPKLFKHAFTHFKLSSTVILRNEVKYPMYSLNDMHKIGIPTFAKKILNDLVKRPEWAQKNACDEV